MKAKSLLLAAALSTAAFAAPASASVLLPGPNVFTFSNTTPFSLLLDITPTADNLFRFTYSGTKDILTSSGFTLSGSGGGLPYTGAAGTLLGGSLTTGFKDSAVPTFNLIAGTHYLLTLSGTIASTAPGGTGNITVTFANGTVTPVPDPESYAMLLAGLGLMGTIARRRSKKAS